MQAVLDLLPKHSGSKCFFDNFIQPAPPMGAAQFRPIGNIVKDGQGERGWEIKDHPDASPEMGKVYLGIVDIRFIQEDRPGVAGPEDQIRQTIKAFEERRLSTASWAEDGKDLFGSNIEIDIL